MVGRIALTLALVLAFTCILAASNPVPLIYQPLNPSNVPPGHAAFTLTVHGTGFVSGAMVKANGVALKTKFVGADTFASRIADFNADGLLDIGLSGVYQSTVLLQVPSK